jgi:hypothetical protein
MNPVPRHSRKCFHLAIQQSLTQLIMDVHGRHQHDEHSIIYPINSWKWLLCWKRSGNSNNKSMLCMIIDSHVNYNMSTYYDFQRFVCHRFHWTLKYCHSNGFQALSICTWIRVITKLQNSEQSYKGKVKTHKYIIRQNQSTTGKLWKP